MSDALALVHLSLTVADVERSVAFYRRWFGFGGPPRASDDGTVVVANADGFDLAFRPGAPTSPPSPPVHVGFRCQRREAIGRLRGRLQRDGVPLIESYDEPAYANLTCLDPDGHEVEVYWEPASSSRACSFDGVVDEYDASRPAHPDGVYDALGPLAGLRVLDGGAGTGIATRALVERGADVVPFDVGPAVLRRAVERTPGLPAVVADGMHLPFRDDAADLVTFAQSWHWLDPESAIEEVARVLCPGGRWAAWWSYARADGEAWYERVQAMVEAACETDRSERDIDWGEALRRDDRFEVEGPIVVPWTRRTSVEEWLTERRSRSYVAVLPVEERERLLADVGAVLRARFAYGGIELPYTTSLWVARRR